MLAPIFERTNASYGIELSRKSCHALAQVLYIPVHLMPYYRQFGWKEGDMPVAEEYYRHCLALPMFPTLTDEEQDWVIEKVLEFVR